MPYLFHSRTPTRGHFLSRILCREFSSRLDPVHPSREYCTIARFMKKHADLFHYQPSPGYQPTSSQPSNTTTHPKMPVVTLKRRASKSHSMPSCNASTSSAMRRRVHSIRSFKAPRSEDGPAKGSLSMVLMKVELSLEALVEEEEVVGRRVGRGCG